MLTAKDGHKVQNCAQQVKAEINLRFDFISHFGNVDHNVYKAISVVNTQ